MDGVRIDEESDQDRQGHVLQYWLRGGAPLGSYGEEEIERRGLRTLFLLCLHWMQCNAVRISHYPQDLALLINAAHRFAVDPVWMFSRPRSGPPAAEDTAEGTTESPSLSTPRACPSRKARPKTSPQNAPPPLQ